MPPQSWEVETEFARDLGKWGKTRLNLHYYRVQDIIDVIPIGEDGQGIGNLPRADRYGFESTSTLLFDPIGWKGAKLDLTIGAEKTSVRDPLTNDKREITGVKDRWMSAQIRHDIPGTQVAWSAYVQHRHYSPYFYLTEVFTEQDIPWMFGFYVEDKNVMGASVRFSVDNIFNGRHYYNRAVYTGYRDRAPIDYFEDHNDLVGPLFSLTVKGISDAHRCGLSFRDAKDRSQRRRANQPHRLSAAVQRRRGRPLRPETLTGNRPNRLRREPCRAKAGRLVLAAALARRRGRVPGYDRGRGRAGRGRRVRDPAAGRYGLISKGTGNGHHLRNDSDRDCIFVVIGGACAPAADSDVDMLFTPEGRYVHKDGTPYET